MRVPIARYPGMNRLVLDWLGGDERFLKRTPWNGGANAALHVRSKPPHLATVAAALDASNRQWGIFATREIDRWARGQAFTIIAGQQVGFAGGPLYTLAKIASLVRMKRDLEARGIPATAFFWLATEDHDYDEVASLNVPTSALPKERPANRQLDLLSLRALRSAEARAIVGTQPIPEALVQQLLSAMDIPRPAWLREGISFRDSFAELIASVFGSEIVLVDALLPALRQAGAPLFDRIVERQAEIQKLLEERAAHLTEAGYQPQVERTGSDYTLLYELSVNGHRQAVTEQRTAERTSTSALTRPLLQDFVLAPDVFVGGPAEVAYYAQVTPLHAMLDVAVPRVALRGHALLAPKRVARTMHRYGLDPADAFTSADAILTEREAEGVAQIRTLVEEGKRHLLEKTAQIGELALPADHSLAGAIQKSIGHLEYHFDKLGQRAIKGLVRKDRERYAALRELVATFYPDGRVQDRVVSWFPYWREYGSHLVDAVTAQIEPDSASFKVVEL